MKGVVYVSQAEIEFDSGALRELAAAAAKRNKAIDVTGYLFFHDGRFLQYIEGPEAAIDELMISIERDRRHRVIARTEDLQVATRRFPTWAMAHISSDDFHRVRMETLLADYLRLMSHAPQTEHDWTDSVWRMVDALANCRARFLDPHSASG